MWTCAPGKKNHTRARENPLGGGPKNSNGFTKGEARVKKQNRLNGSKENKPKSKGGKKSPPPKRCLGRRMANKKRGTRGNLCGMPAGGCLETKSAR